MFLSRSSQSLVATTLIDKWLAVFTSHDMKAVVKTTICILFVLQSSGPHFFD